MTVEKFDRRLDVGSDAPACWEVLTDVRLLASWVSIVHDAKEITRLERYSAVLQDKLGPLTLRADLAIDVEVVADGREVRVRAAGRDAQVNSQIKVDATMTLEPHGTRTEVQVQGTYQVVGRVASMGGGIIRKKADLILEEFFGQADGTLNATAPR